MCSAFGGTAGSFATVRTTALEQSLQPDNPNPLYIQIILSAKRILGKEINDKRMQVSKTSEKKGNTFDSVSTAVIVFWIIPVVSIAILTRFAVDTTPPAPLSHSRPISINFDQNPASRKAQTRTPRNEPATSTKRSRPPPKSPILGNKPTSYKEVGTSYFFFLRRN